MSAKTTIRLPAKKYEDHDDSLSVAAEEYAAAHSLNGWDLDARWADEQRDEILLTVPVLDKTEVNCGYAPDLAPANGTAQGELVLLGDDGVWRYGSANGGGPYMGPVFETEDQARAEACYLFGAEMVPNRYPRGSAKLPERPAPIVVVE